MNIDISDDQRQLILYTDYQLELDIITNGLTRESPDAYIIKKKVGNHVNTERKFINGFNCVPAGLWLEVLKLCQDANIKVTMSDGMLAFMGIYNLTLEQFNAYIDDMFEDAFNDKGQPFKPYQYQIDAAFNFLKYRKCCGEICTSGGKTLTSYIIFKYLYQKCNVKRMLYVVPSVDLAKQSIEKYEMYESFLSPKKCDTSWEAGILYSPMKKKDLAKLNTCNILFGTYQSLSNKKFEFFNDFTACLIDEAHHASNKSIRDIIIKSVNLQFCMGMTGTFPKKEHMDYLTIQSYIGPVVYKFTTDELINEEKKGTPIYINTHILDWATDEEKRNLYLMRKNKSKDDPQAGTRCLKQEQLFVNDSYTRLKYICDLAIRIKKNTLVLFGDIKGGYGKRIYNYIKEYSRKTVYYCDGTTPSKTRDLMKENMEDDVDGNTVMVASIGTMGEGIDLKNLWCIILVNTAKSERIVRQIIGRGIRLYEGKTKVVMIDIVDDMRWREAGRTYDNYMWKHYRNRRAIYDEQKFPVIEQNIEFQKSNSLI